MVFHKFCDLPFELRAHIWHHTLPDVLGPTVYPWESNLLELTKEADRPSGLPGNHGDYFEFREDKLTGPLFALPTAYVNSEARVIAKAWIQLNAIKLHSQRDRDHPLFSRTMDGSKDVLYLHSYTMRTFAQEVLNRNYGIPFDHSRHSAPIKSPRFAVIIDGSDLFRAWFGKFDMVLCSSFNLISAVYVIVNDTVGVVQPPRKCGPAPFDVKTKDPLTDPKSREWHNWNEEQLISSFKWDEVVFRAHLITIQNASWLPFAGPELTDTIPEMRAVFKYEGPCGPNRRRYEILPLLAVPRRVINGYPWVECEPGGYLTLGRD